MKKHLFSLPNIFIILLFLIFTIFSAYLSNQIINTSNENTNITMVPTTNNNSSYSISNQDSSIIYIGDFQRNPNDTSDATRIKEAIGNLKDGDTLLFEPNQTYLIDENILISDKNNIIIDGNNSTIKSLTNLPSATFLITTSTKYSDTNTLLPISKNQSIFKISIPSAQVGDIIEFWDNSTSWDYNVTPSAWGEIINKTDDLIEISHPSYFDFTANYIRVFSTSDSITVKNLNIESNSKNIALQLENVTNSTVDNCYMQGNGGRIGIFIKRSLNTLVSNSQMDNFFDIDLIDNKTGYGIDLFGHNCSAVNNIITNTKHSIASNGYSTNILYKGNIVYSADNEFNDQQSHIIDAHENTEITVQDNIIYNSKAVPSIKLRGWKSSVLNNTIILSDINLNFPNKSPIISFYGNNQEGVEVKNNIVLGNTSNYSNFLKFFVNTYFNQGNILIDNNKFDGSIEIINRTDLNGKNGIINSFTLTNNISTTPITVNFNDSLIKESIIKNNIIE